jgi:hypothetical protein
MNYWRKKSGPETGLYHGVPLSEKLSALPIPDVGPPFRPSVRLPRFHIRSY